MGHRRVVYTNIARRSIFVLTLEKKNYAQIYVGRYIEFIHFRVLSQRYTGIIIYGFNMDSKLSSCAMKNANVVVVVFSLLAAKYTRKRQQSWGFTTERHAWYIEIDSWPKKSFFLYIYTHPLSTHTSVILVFVPESIVRIYVQ